MVKTIRKNKFITSFCSQNPPMEFVDLNQSFIVETNDCYCGQIQKTKDLRSQIDSSLINASTGPIFIREVHPGDTICVNIHKIKLNPHGLMLTYKGLGPLGEMIKEEDTKIIRVREGKAYFNEQIVLNLNPMIGVIGVSPKGEEISCECPGDHGGNMDTKDIKEGSKVYLPVFNEGGGLAVGDLHGAMGDGELCGMALEIGGEVELSISKIPQLSIKMPIVETEEEYLIIASEIDFERSSKKGILYATQLLQQSLAIDFKDAYRLLSATCDLRISQMVNPLITIRIAIPKYIAPHLIASIK